MSPMPLIGVTACRQTLGKYDSRAGSVWVNQYDGGDMTAPFGGFKQSGNGRDKSLHAFDKYTELKATWIKL